MTDDHQDKIRSNLIIAKNVKWVNHKNNQLLVPQTNKQTGFENKTRWDKWLFLVQGIGALAIPLSVTALFISVWQFNVQQHSDSQKTAEQAQAQFKSQKYQQQQATLDTYLYRMADPLHSCNLS